MEKLDSHPLQFSNLIQVIDPDEAQFPAIGFSNLRGKLDSDILIEKATQLLKKPPTHYYYSSQIQGYVFWVQKGS